MTSRSPKPASRAVAAAASAFAVFLTAAAVFSFLNAPVANDPINVRIAPGMTAREIASALSHDKVIRSALFFRVVSRAKGYDGRFRSGRYTIPAGSGTTDVARHLAETIPAPFDIRVTVAEGLNLREIAALLARKAKIDSSAFAAFATSKAAAESMGVDNATLEGYLYPDTYFLPEGAKAYDVIRKMNARFREAFSDSLKKRAAKLGFTVNQAVTLASLIETEAASDAERPVISSIFHRRLKAGLPLQANPTIQYALGEKRRVFNGDLDVDSPYNTYRNRGLPPGPIACPGMKSIVAALYPAETEYLYFVANGDGSHTFSKSLAEHSSAVARYKKTRLQRSK